jgi:glycosyltransferase involved in cell wall biosynthesis
MNKNKVSIYVRNKEITPSSYYRIIQFAKCFEDEVIIREIASYKIYNKFLNADKTQKLSYYYLGILYYFTMLSRATYYLLIDLFVRPDYVILSKTFCPRYTPYYLLCLIDSVTKKAKFYWDFDDYIFESGEISKKQASILEKNSKNIVVTSDFLRSKIRPEYRNKVILLPTTDGDLQGFNKIDLMKNRRTTFDRKINLVWVATAGNIPSLLKIIEVLDKAAAKIKRDYNKDLLLVVVCNKPVEVEVTHLNIKNIKWTRDVAKEEIYNAHIGLMPLINREYALGKGGFKLVQYISTGLPVIASNIGFNKDIVDKKCGILIDDIDKNDDWLDAIIQIATSWEVWKAYSAQAYSQWESKFSFDHNLEVWKELLRK